MSIERIVSLEIDLSNYGRGRRDLLRDFLKAIKPLIDEINQDIDTYNTLSESWTAWLMPSAYISEKAKHLASIEAKIKAMDDAQSDDNLVCCPQYFEKIHGKLFREIQEEHQKLDRDAGIQASTSPLTLAELVAQMDPNKVNEMTAILAQEKGDDLHAALRDLYKPGKAGEEKEKKAFDGFLKTYIITILGGSNSKNFKVTHRETKKTQVLKVEHRLSGTKEAESQLREGVLSEVLTFVDAERRAIYSDKTRGNPVSRSLQVTEFCPGSDIEAYGLLLKNDEFRLISAASFHHEMADILMRMQKAGYAFPDMKNSNWLIDLEGQVRIADGKALVFSDTNGNIKPRVALTQTPFISAPEIQERPRSVFSADKAHAYMLGKNLYQYLTACSIDDFYGRNADGEKYIISDAAELDFSHDIFETEKGAQFKQLIEATVKTNPGERLSLAEVQARIQAIDPQYEQAEARQIEILQRRCWAHLIALGALAIGPADSKMEAFLNEQAALLQQTPRVQALLQLEKNLQKTRENIEIISSGVQEEIKRLNVQKMEKEVDVIEYLMCNMSLEDRKNIIQFDTPEAEKLIEVLNSIEKKERIQTPNAPNIAKLLNFMNEQKEFKKLNVAVARFESLCAQMDSHKLKVDDEGMDSFMTEIKQGLGGRPTSQDFEGSNQRLEGTLRQLEVFSKAIELERQTLASAGKNDLFDAVVNKLSKLPVRMRRDNAPDLIRLIKENRAIQKTKAFKQEVSDGGEGDTSKNSSVNRINRS